MALNDFLKIKTVREKFAEEFPKSRSKNKEILAIHSETYKNKSKLIVNDRGYLEYSLSFEEIIKFLWYLGDKIRYRVVWDLDFFISSISELWDDREKRKLLLKGSEVILNSYKLHYVPSKIFKIRKKKKLLKITDISILFDKSTLSDKETFLNSGECDMDYINENNNDLDYRNNSLYEIKEKGMKKCQIIKSKCEILINNIKEIHKIPVKKKILAEPLTKNYSLIGTAFDYLFRFYIQRRNPRSVTYKWVAEASVRKLELKTSRLKLKSKSRYKKAKKIVSNAKKLHIEYINGDIQLTDKFLRSIIGLAKLDTIFRSEYPEDLKSVDNDDISDLKNLISIIKNNDFNEKSTYILNPTFNKASRLLKGADADFIIDDALIDIKTTKSFNLNRDYLNEIIGYYTLYRIGGISGLNPDYEIKKIGIYFSRHAYLHLINVEDFINEKRFPDFVKWFMQKAGEIYKTEDIKKELVNRLHF